MTTRKRNKVVARYVDITPKIRNILSLKFPEMRVEVDTRGWATQAMTATQASNYIPMMTRIVFDDPLHIIIKHDDYQYLSEQITSSPVRIGGKIVHVSQLETSHVIDRDDMCYPPMHYRARDWSRPWDDYATTVNTALHLKLQVHSIEDVPQLDKTVHPLPTR